MKVGTAEPIKEVKKERKVKAGPSLRSSRRIKGGGGNDGGNGGDGGNSGGGGDRPERNEAEQTTGTSPQTTRILMWFLLMVVIMTFSALIGAYIVLSTNNALEWRPFALPVQVWVSTVIILLSSVTYHFSKLRLLKEKYKETRFWLMATTILGAAFISSQILAWMQLFNMGLYAKGNPYAGFFYILTGAHVIHVLGGIAALGYVILRVKNLKPTSPLRLKIETEVASVGLYWHTMGVLWLILLFLLGFWK